jgi:transcriptional regulator with XRE-family HTH domain
VDVAERFGRNLARLRQQRELTQEELAGLASIHRTQVGLLEAGKREPRISTVIKLAGALAVEPSELLAGVRWTPPSRSDGKFRFSG